LWLCKQGQVRALALRVLAEFLRCHADRFGQYVEATIVKTLEAHRDAVKEVTVLINAKGLVRSYLFAKFLFTHL